MRKSISISIRVSEDELEKFKEAARQPQISFATFHVILTRLSVFLPDVSGWTVVARAVRKFFLFPYPQLFVMITNIQQTADCYYLLIHNIPNGKFKSVLPIYPHG